MNTSRIISLIETRTGIAAASYKQDDLDDLSVFFAHESIGNYLLSCLPIDSYVASGVSVHNLDRIRGEICEGASPGGFIFPHGYLVVASSVGGNAICFHSSTGRVVWADHTSFHSDSISYENRTTRKWIYLPFSTENISQAVVPLSDNIGTFMEDLLLDKLTEQLITLD